MSVKLHSQKAGRQMAADMADAEQIKIGAAAERKRRRESDDSIDALLVSDAQSGKAVYWQRKIGDRDSIEVERSGAYSERAFLRLAEKAAGQAGRGRWNRPEAVEAVAAELIARVLAKTQGRMPKRGSLGRHAEHHENPDLAYLTVSARRLIVSAQRGEGGGLAAEAAPVADAVDVEGTSIELDMGELMAEADAAAEGPRDPYLADPVEPGADLLAPQSRKAADALAQMAGKRSAACTAALAAALRGPVAKSADLADAGYATSPGSARKAAQRGRDVLRDALDLEPEDARDDDEDAIARAFANLCEIEDRDHAERHPMEGAPIPTYRAPNLDWPLVTQPKEIAPLKVYRSTADREA